MPNTDVKDLGRFTRRVVAAMLVGAACLGCKPAQDTGTGSTAPNVLLITIESLRPDHVGYHGYERETTPALDALATQAIRFDNAYSVTSWTLAAHASLFTGLYPTAANIVFPKDRLGPAYVTLAEVLSGAGYDTAAIVSGPYLRRAFKLDQGFAAYDDSIVSPAGTGSIDDVTNPKMQAALLARLDGYQNTKKPFFLFAYFWDPHYDYIPPPPYDTMFLGPDAKPIDLTHYDGPKNKVTKDISAQELAYVVSQYDGEIRSTDDVLGRVFVRMKELDLWDNTLVIVTSDHGEEFFEHGNKGHKNTLYAESVRVPLVIKPPGKTTAKRDSRLASFVDIFPTVLDYAGIEHELSLMHGRSLLDADAGLPIYFELATSWYFKNRRTGKKWRDSERWLSVRDGQYRVIGMENERKKTRRWELFDVAADPGERNPLGDDHAEVLGTMHAQAQQWYSTLQQLAAAIGERGQATLTPEEIEQLRSLGYLN